MLPQNDACENKLKIRLLKLTNFFKTDVFQFMSRAVCFSYHKSKICRKNSSMTLDARRVDSITEPSVNLREFWLIPFMP